MVIFILVCIWVVWIPSPPKRTWKPIPRKRDPWLVLPWDRTLSEVVEVRKRVTCSLLTREVKRV